MRIIARQTIKSFWERGHADAEGPLRAWYAEASRATWNKPDDVKRRFPHASVIDAERLVFNIGGNKYRLVVKVWWRGHTIFIKFVGTHAQYDQLDVRSV